TAADSPAAVASHRCPHGIGGQGNCGGAERFLVACSKAYASSTSFGSLHAEAVKVTPNGAGLGSKPAGKACAPVPCGTGRSAYGTVIDGYPGRAAMPALLTPGKSRASRRCAFMAASIPLVAERRMSLRRSAS